MAGLLTISGDSLKFDPLKEDALKNEVDPYSKNLSNRVKTYDKEWGFSMHPEEKAAALQYKGGVDTAVEQSRGVLDEYKTSQAAAMAEADSSAQGILGQARAAIAAAPSSVRTIPIRVVDASGTNIERVYNLPRTVAEELERNGALTTAWVDDGAAFNVSTRVDGGATRGQEIHDMLANAEEQVRIANGELSAAREAADIQYGAMQESVDSQRGIAQNAYDTQVDLAEQQIAAIQAKWTTFLTEQKTAFQSGLKTNTGGIRDLVESGALVMRGTVNNG